MYPLRIQLYGLFSINTKVLFTFSAFSWIHRSPLVYGLRPCFQSHFKRQLTKSPQFADYIYIVYLHLTEQYEYDKMGKGKPRRK